MNSAQAIDRFWNRFGLLAYDKDSVPKGAAFPYITYEVADGGEFGSSAALSASLWYKDSSWKAITEKTEAIKQYIGRGGVNMRTDSGIIWIQMRTPFAQRMGDPDNDMIRRMVLNVSVDFLTND